MRSNQVGRKILSALLALCLVLSMFPGTVLAAEGETEPDATALLQQQIDAAAAKTRGRFFCLDTFSIL